MYIPFCQKDTKQLAMTMLSYPFFFFFFSDKWAQNILKKGGKPQSIQRVYKVAKKQKTHKQNNLISP